MSYSIIITPAFERGAKPLLKKYNFLSDELINLLESLEKEPVQGTPLGNNYQVFVSFHISILYVVVFFDIWY